MMFTRTTRTSSRSPTRPVPPSPRFFVKTQGFEKRFFVQNFKRYFGGDVTWFTSVDMNTGDEGFELRSSLQDSIKAVLVARMREDAEKEYQTFLNRRRSQNIENVVDRSPQLAAASCPHLDLFPSLDNDDSNNFLTHAGTHLVPARLRLSHSMPASPATEFYQPINFPVSVLPSEIQYQSPPSLPQQGPPTYAWVPQQQYQQYTQPAQQQQQQQSSLLYTPSNIHVQNTVPELLISQAGAGRRPSLRNTRSDENIVSGRTFSHHAHSFSGFYSPVSPVYY